MSIFKREMQRSFVTRFNSFVCKLRVMQCTHQGKWPEFYFFFFFLEIKRFVLKWINVADLTSFVVDSRSYPRTLCVVYNSCSIVVIFKTEKFAIRHVIFIDSIWQFWARAQTSNCFQLKISDHKIWKNGRNKLTKEPPLKCQVIYHAISYKKKPFCAKFYNSTFYIVSNSSIEMGFFFLFSFILCF